MSTLHLNSLYSTSILHHCFSPFIHISFRHPSRSPPVLNCKFVCIHRSVLESLPARPVLHAHNLISDLSVVWPTVAVGAACSDENTVSLRNHLKKQGKKITIHLHPVHSALISPVLLRRCAVINGNAALPQRLPLLCIRPVVY